MTNLLAMTPSTTAGLVMGIIAGVVILLVVLILFATRYKKCPSDKVMVIYGKVSGKNSSENPRSSICFHGGARMVWPFVQAYEFLDLKPISFLLDLKELLVEHNIKLSTQSRFTVAISTEPEKMQNAAERLLGLNTERIKELAEDIILGQIRKITFHSEIIHTAAEYDRFLEELSRDAEKEIGKIGLRLISVRL